MPAEVPLGGGVANAGKVTRRGDVVLRPAAANTPTIHRFLVALRQAGFTGAPEPLGVEGEREKLGFLDGDVAVPPYPAWVQTDAALGSIVALVRAFHTASAGVNITDGDWSAELADSVAGPIVCHNDVCLENVVFRDGQAVALLDFDYAAPGRPTFDLTRMARLCVPIDDDESAAALGWLPADRPTRLRLIMDAYGLKTRGRQEVLTMLDDGIATSGEFVRRRVEAGDPGFVEMWAKIGGAARFDRRRAWWAAERETFVTALR